MKKKLEESWFFEIGGMWGRSGWQIISNVRCEGREGLVYPCLHCTGIRKTKTGRDRQEWICPRMVVAEDAEGLSTTGVCLDCILDAAKKIEAEEAK